MTELSYEAIDTEKMLGPWKYPLKERIERHLEAIENAHAWHTGRSPWGPPVAPNSLLGQAALRFIDQVAPVPPGTMHAKVEIETAAALRLDRQPMAYGQFINKFEKRGRKWFTFEGRWRDETGLILGKSRITMAFPGEAQAAKGDDEKDATKERAAPGKAELSLTRKLTQERMTAFSEDSENAIRGQSIHVQPEVANKAGFDATVAQGLMAAEYLNELMEQALAKDWYENARLSVTFLRPMLCGDEITAAVRLANTLEEGAVLRRVYDVWATSQRGEMVAAGTASGLVIPAA